jgi:hypothetical protein
MLEGALALQAASAQPMNACPLRLDYLRWVPLTLPQGHAAQTLLAKAEHQRLHQEYGQQKRQLDERHRILAFPGVDLLEELAELKVGS